jgi:two-component system, NtrC family, nitrogen regulation sensor histidine kinase NtrY
VRPALHCLVFATALMLLMNAVLHLHNSRPMLALLLAFAGAVLLAALDRYILWRPLAQQLKALSTLIAAWRDQEFSTSIAQPEQEQLKELTNALNSLGERLRSERVTLVQRELLLDTVIQNTPNALVLLDADDRVVMCNLAARELLNLGRRFEGERWLEMLAHFPETLQSALAANRDGLVALEASGTEEVFHLSQRDFSLQARRHRLILLRRLTTELARQEVQTWKKVIRVISHELNNSLAPISSMAHSGSVLLKRGDLKPLTQVFDTIGERSKHLAQFIASYARVAKLPQPQRSHTHWQSLLERVQALAQAGVIAEIAPQSSAIDAVQVEQLLINLIKNAVEAGSPPDQVVISVLTVPDGVALEVSDRGSGMSEAVMASALLPFYSTKRSGSGLGLALAREIAEAHGGRLSLSNRQGGGLSVRVVFPFEI